MDLKALEKELDQTDIHVVGEEKTEDAEAAQENAGTASAEADVVTEQMEESAAEETEADNMEDAGTTAADVDDVTEPAEEPAEEESEAEKMEDAKSAASETPDEGNEDDSTAAEAA